MDFNLKDMSDPIKELVHDHVDIHRRVLELSKLIAHGGTGALAEPLGDLREELFRHFALEEEGLFPFLAKHFPDLEERVGEMLLAHDTVCGALARMCHLAEANPSADVTAMFERFEVAYAKHAQVEADLLTSLHGRLGDAERAELATLVRDL